MKRFLFALLVGAACTVAAPAQAGFWDWFMLWVAYTSDSPTGVGR